MVIDKDVENENTQNIEVPEKETQDVQETQGLSEDEIKDIAIKVAKGKDITTPQEQQEAITIDSSLLKPQVNLEEEVSKKVEDVLKPLKEKNLQNALTQFLMENSNLGLSQEDVNNLVKTYKRLNDDPNLELDVMGIKDLLKKSAYAEFGDKIAQMRTYQDEKVYSATQANQDVMRGSILTSGQPIVTASSQKEVVPISDKVKGLLDRKGMDYKEYYESIKSAFDQNRITEEMFWELTNNKI